MLEVSNVHAGYFKGVDILEGLTLKVDKQSVTSIIGPNGSGKSTLLKTIYGILRPSKGSILFQDRSIVGLNQVDLLSLGLAFIPQERTVFPLMSVQENLEVAAKTVLRNNLQVKEAMDHIYHAFPKLGERKQVRAGRLSGGEQKMVEIARALMFRPKLVMLDEPTAGLSPRLSAQVYEEIRKMREQGITVALVDQNVKEAIQAADYVYAMEAGRVKMEGNGSDLRSKVDGIVKMWLRA